jgi:hypothetical protein
MAPPLYRTFTPEQLATYGRFAGNVDEFATRTRVYQTPFLYPNMEVGNFYEIDVMKGIEFKADEGYLTIAEDRPIVAVTVVGSGCVPRGYNIVEWWEEGEGIASVDNRTVKRLRVDDLNGIHPSIWVHLLAKVAFARGIGYDAVSPGDIKDDCDLLHKLTNGFYDSLPLSFHENSAHFALGHTPVVTERAPFEALGHSFAGLPAGAVPLAYPRRITIRCGCKGTEDTRTRLERTPADYAIRLVQVQVKDV